MLSIKNNALYFDNSCIQFDNVIFTSRFVDVSLRKIDALVYALQVNVQKELDYNIVFDIIRINKQYIGYRKDVFAIDGDDLEVCNVLKTIRKIVNVIYNVVYRIKKNGIKVNIDNIAFDTYLYLQNNYVTIHTNNGIKIYHTNDDYDNLIIKQYCSRNLTNTKIQKNRIYHKNIIYYFPNKFDYDIKVKNNFKIDFTHNKLYYNNLRKFIIKNKNDIVSIDLTAPQQLILKFIEHINSFNNINFAISNMHDLLKLL